MKDTKRRFWIGAGLSLFVLAAMLLFFEKAHPLVILDMDDWTYISSPRIALPAGKFWNPSRILPELLMPYACSLGVMLFARLGYIPSITATNGLVLSLFITVYVYEFFRLLTDRVKLREGASALLALLFLLLHFSLLRTEPVENDYLFRAADVTCVYYYVIPALVNGSLVMLLARTGIHRRFWEKDRLLLKSLLVPAAYLAVFSNLFASILLASWCGLDLLLSLPELRGRKTSLRDFWKEQAFSLAVVLLWLLSVAFESVGGRGAAASELPYGAALGQSFRGAAAFFGGIYVLPLLLLAGALAALAAALLLRSLAPEQRETGRTLLLPLLLTGAVTLLFEILLCARVRPEYIRRSEVMLAVCFVLLALAMLALALLLKRWERLVLLLPLVLLVLFSATDTHGRTFGESNDILAQADLCTALDEDIVEQVLAAQERGEKQATVYVMDVGNESNWPQNLRMGDRVADSLYTHGVTRERMEIEIVPSREINRRFHVLEDQDP